MSLDNAYKATKLIETVENYSKSDNTNFTEQGSLRPSNKELFFYSNDSFWKTILNNPDYYWHKLISLSHFVVCDWVPRIPGIYWTTFSNELRRYGFNEIETVYDNNRFDLSPGGKTKMVLGGLATIKLPPNDEGKRLLSISSNHNSSLGIPVLFYPEVLDHFDLKQGDIIEITEARWQPMDIFWASRFATTKGIPRGLLIVDKIKQLKVIHDNVPVLFHPFSIMEYQDYYTQLYDFVFLPVYSNYTDLRTKIENFFNNYAVKNGRNGKYLISPDYTHPIFECEYLTPDEMRDPSEKAKLALLYKRIYDVNFDDTTLRNLIRTLPGFYETSEKIKTLAKLIGIEVSVLKEDNAISMSAQLINYCMDSGKIEELIDRMIVDYPEIFK